MAQVGWKSFQNEKPSSSPLIEFGLVSSFPEGADWTDEVKLDGYRAIGGKTSRVAILYSRNGNNFNRRYPYIAEALAQRPADTVMDGEVVALDVKGSIH